MNLDSTNMLDSPQGIYAPLRQAADSDSESEGNSEKIVYGVKNIKPARYQTKRMLSVPILTYSNSVMETLHCTNSNFNNNTEENSQNEADNVAILGTNCKSEPISPIRKFFFIMSLILCGTAVIIFIFFLPCNEKATCPALVDRTKIHNWLNTYNKFELKGTVNVANGIRSWEKNLIFMYRSDKFFPELQPNNHKRNGIISLGNSGKISWYNEMENEPIAIDCNLIDVNKNGKSDCLVIDEFGHVGAFDSVWGLWFWNFKNNFTSQKVDVLNFPVILPDLDGDSVKELLLATSTVTGGRIENYLRILSGRIGQPLAQGYYVKDCTKIQKFKLEKEIISYICSKNETEIQSIITVSELYALITNKPLTKNLTQIAKIPQHKVYGQRKETLSQRNIFTNDGKELVIENQGVCPENCNMTVTWCEQRNGKKHIIGFINGSRMYGMVPALWSFKKTDGKPKLSGFVMKFWEWSDQETNLTKVSKRDYFSNLKKREIDVEDRLNQTTLAANDYNIFEKFIKNHKTFTISRNENVRPERSIANITKQKSNFNSFLNYKMRIIKEKVVLIIFKSANTRIENTSQTNIIQFCRNDKNGVVCQPDLNYQENSLLIADLDGSQELISFYSTFAYKNDERKDWILKTYVQLLRLESELPILYEESEH